MVGLYFDSALGEPLIILRRFCFGDVQRDNDRPHYSDVRRATVHIIQSYNQTFLPVI